MAESNNRKIIRRLSQIIDYMLNVFLSRIIYEREISKIMKYSSIPNTKIKGEDEWVKKWSQLGVYINRKYYRTFSRYLDNGLNDLTEICPDDVCHNYIEPLLNPVRYRSFYFDKNEFDRIGGGYFPATILRNQNGRIMDEDYNNLNKNVSDLLRTVNCNDLVAKPSIDSASGKGVRFFHRSNENGQFYDVKSGELLSFELLESSYPEQNYIVQERAEQSSFMSQFCHTSINTLRIQLYRSVTDNNIYIPNMILRIGREGALTDNAHGGGAFIGIDANGQFQDHLCDQYGNKYSVFNGINFSEKSFKLPNLEEIIEFAKSIGEKIHHSRLIALDIMIDKDDYPKLIEYNIDAFSLWLFQFTTGTAFGPWTDEIIKYVKDHKKEATRLYLGV